MKKYTVTLSALSLITITGITTWLISRAYIAPQIVYIPRNGFEDPSFAFQFS